MTTEQTRVANKIYDESYSVQYVTVNQRGVSYEMRRKNKGGTPFLVVLSPLTGNDTNVEFYFPTRQLPPEEILKQFEAL